MKIIDRREMLNLMNKYYLIPDKKCLLVNQETGDAKKVRTDLFFHYIKNLKNPIFMTDDDGVIKIVTMEIYYNYIDNNLDSGYVMRMFLYRSGQNRMQHRYGSI